ncbi:MAG TPA: phage holin family protein [Chitinophagales bacterium]|jgi:putative membrane protein|nr:phage holin family protein [Chitinophagales bacterium]MBP6153315.1 phage holin family protein [Chitinophagales bacterium]HQV78425.1 phage holin family protein [Chitinophagales bacterium]HQW78889.1 phage holin family protein [Chitinophagales bacterium]HRB67497.1 phage holin family protein [Chitinophagales bacterium]
MKLIIRFLIKVATVIALSYILPALWSKFPNPIVSGPMDAIKVALVLSILNTFLKPIISFFSLPITCLTLGFFSLVISAAMVILTDNLLNGFQVGGWIPALAFSIAFSFISVTIEELIVDDK